jgi:hypothetical protein
MTRRAVSTPWANVRVPGAPSGSSLVSKCLARRQPGAGAIGRVPETGQAGNPLPVGDAAGERPPAGDTEGAGRCVGSPGRQVHSVRGW